MITFDTTVILIGMQPKLVLLLLLQLSALDLSPHDASDPAQDLSLLCISNFSKLLLIVDLSLLLGIINIDSTFSFALVLMLNSFLLLHSSASKQILVSAILGILSVVTAPISMLRASFLYY